MPKVSVIIPIYNKVKRLKYSIKSVLNQTYKNFELILINDGSTDGSGKIAKEYSNNYSQIRYYNQENQGVAAARNYGIELAKGKYISFVDADDELNPFFLEKMVSKISNSNVCYCGHYYVTGRQSKKARMNFYENDILDKYLYNLCTPNTNSWLIKKEFIRKYNINFPVNTDWGEDMLFFSKIIFYDKNIKYVDEYLTEYHLDNKNNLSENHINKIEKDIKWMATLENFIKENENDNNRKINALKAIQTYRLPAAVIYRLYNNLEIEEKNNIKTNLIKNNEYIKNINLSNGIRSIKLYIYYIMLKIKLR